MPPHASRQCW